MSELQFAGRKSTISNVDETAGESSNMQFPGTTNELVTHEPPTQIFPSPHVVPKFEFLKIFELAFFSLF